MTKNNPEEYVTIGMVQEQRRKQWLEERAAASVTSSEIDALGPLLAGVVSGARKGPIAPPAEQVPKDVIALVIAAREVMEYLYGLDGDRVEALDRAVEAFADRVPFDDEPDAALASESTE